MDHRIPVTLLTGFLGSGKTTLLNQLLPQTGMKDSAVLINELGEAGLDHILAQNVDSTYIADNTVLLESGCVCCTLSNELADTMRDMYFKRAVGAFPEFKRLIIETTGLADPGPILGNLLNESVIESVYRLDAVVVTIDALYGAQHIAEHAEARKQAAVADVLLITKPDLANKQQLADLKELLINLNPGATQHLVQNGKIEADFLVDVGLYDMRDQAPEPQRWLRAPVKPAGLFKQQHGEQIHHFTVTLPQPLTWAAFKPTLLKFCQTHGAKLLRLKGILFCSDEEFPLAVHAVHFTPYPVNVLQGYSEEVPQSRIVIIGYGLDEAQARADLTTF